MRINKFLAQTGYWEKTIVSITLIIYLALSISVGLNRYWQFNAFWYDFGIFDETVWKLSRFQLPIIEQLSPPHGEIVWGDHFNPSAILLTPFYWITDRTEIIIVAQSLFVTISAGVFYFISRDLIKNALARFALLLSFMGYVGLQNALYTDVHNIVFAMLPLSLAFWAIYKRAWKLYWLFLLLTLGFQETMSAVGIGLGIFIILKCRKDLNVGFLTILISLVWGLVFIKFLGPALVGHSYTYQPQVPASVIDMAKSLVIPYDLKLKTILVTFATFGFIPVISISTIFLIFENFFERFVLNAAATRWDLGFHYNALLSPIMFVATLEALLIIQKTKFRRFITLWAIITILVTIFIHRFYYHGPLLLATNRIFYDQTKNAKFLDNFVKQIPTNGLLMTQNNFAAHFTHKNVILLNKNYEQIMPDIIAIDIRGGQNANNFFPLSEGGTKELISSLYQNPNYIDESLSKNELIFIRKDFTKL